MVSRSFALSEYHGWIVDMRVPIAHVYENGSCPSKDQQHGEDRK